MLNILTRFRNEPKKTKPDTNDEVEVTELKEELEGFIDELIRMDEELANQKEKHN